MKGINLLTHVHAFRNVSFENFRNYFNYECGAEQANIREFEEEDLISFIKYLGIAEYSFYENFYYGFSIPQISKEFDLLRLDESTIINVEIKRTCTLDKMEKQLLRNNYYLSFLGRNIYLFCYIVDVSKIYYYDGANLRETDKNQLITLLYNQQNCFEGDLDVLFEPKNYLVSPFNNTEAFIEGKYFLSGIQETIKTEILSSIDANEKCFYEISGEAGCGKTLLAYDMARELIEKGKEVYILHSGILNQGHHKLIAEYGWNIIQAKYYLTLLDKKIDVLFIDEGQRFWDGQFNTLIQKVKSDDIKCIFCQDKEQVLNLNELNYMHDSLDIPRRVYKLKGKIRTNKEISAFINGLFHLDKVVKDIDYQNVNISYFDNFSKAGKFIKYMKTKGYIFINYTSNGTRAGTFRELKSITDYTAHKVIGQEFDKIIVQIDSSFYYEGNELKSSELELDYIVVKMLYQALTRARSQIHIVIINNESILNTCLKILNHRF